MQVDVIFQIAILIMSVVIHEVAHGYAALYLKHLDPFGSVILPLILAISHAGFIFGWAKPVPYNPYNLRPGRWSEAIVALAGPASNIILALIFGLLLRSGISGNPAFVQIIATIAYINVLLAVFNLVPLPPLDGSKLLFALFPDKLFQIRGFFERYGLVLVLLFIFFLWQFISPVITWLFRLITGVAI